MPRVPFPRAPLARLLGVALALSFAGGVVAQTAPSIASPPARINDLERTLRPAEPAATRPDERPRTVVDELKVDESAQPRPEARAQAARFQLLGIRIVGNTTLDESDIVARARPFVGREVGTAELQALAAQITELYVRRGFVTSRCVVPAQRVEDGRVVLQIEEDKLANVVLSGSGSYRYEARIFFGQLEDLRGRIIDATQLSDRIRLLARIPGARVQPVLRKTAFGQTDLVLEISELVDQGTVAVANDGNRYTSRERLNVGRVFNNPTGHGDVLSVSIASSLPQPRFFGGIQLAYQRPLGTRGGRLIGSASDFFYRLDPKRVGNDAIRYEGGSTLWELQYEEPVPLGRDDASLLWFGGVERRSVQARTLYNTYFGAGALAGGRYVDTEDRLSVAVAGLRYEGFSDLVGRRGTTQWSLAARQSIPGWFGSTTRDDVANKLENLAAGAFASATVRGPIGDARGLDPGFLKWYGSAARVQSLPGDWSLRADVALEYTTSHKIPQAYEFVGADNGASGARAQLLATRPLGMPNLTLGLGWTKAVAWSWYRAAANGGTPGCQHERGIYEARSDARNRCAVDWPFASLAWRDTRMFAELTLLGPLPYFDPNGQRVRLSVGATW